MNSAPLANRESYMAQLSLLQGSLPTMIGLSELSTSAVKLSSVTVLLGMARCHSWKCR